MIEKFKLEGKFTIELIKSNGDHKIIHEINQSGDLKEGSRLNQNISQ